MHVLSVTFRPLNIKEAERHWQLLDVEGFWSPPCGRQQLTGKTKKPNLFWQSCFLSEDVKGWALLAWLNSMEMQNYASNFTPPPSLPSFSHLPRLTLACSCLAVSSYKRISPAGPPSSLYITKLLALHNVLMIFVRSHCWCEQTKYREHRGCGKWSLNYGKRYLSSKLSIVVLFLCDGGGGGVSVLLLHLHLRILKCWRAGSKILCYYRAPIFFFACLRSILSKITRVVSHVCERFNLLCSPISLIRCNVALFHYS